MEHNEISSKKSILQRLRLFFIRPVELFRDYIEKPAWVLKFLIIALASALYAYMTKVLGKDLFAEMMEEQAASMPPEQAEAVRASIPFMNSPTMNLISAGVAVISIIAIILLVSLVYMAFIRVMKGSITYKQVLSIYTLAYMASVIGMAVKSAFMFLTGNLLYINMRPTYADAFYNNADPFIIWQAILMVFGISAVSGITEKKSTIIVACMWLVSLGISLGSVMLAK